MRNLKTVLILFFAVIWTNLSAQTTFSLSQSDIACGEQTCLQVSVQGFTNILTFQYSMNWDAAILGNASVQSFGIGDLSAANFNLANPGIARIGWDDSNTTGISLTDNTVVFEICFDEVGGNTATSAVQFSSNPIAIEVIDSQGELITPNFNNGAVAVSCDTMEGDGGNNMDSSLTFSATQTTANCGEQVCVDINASGFSNIVSFQYAMNWDANLLGTATVQGFGIANMDASQFNASTPGILRVGYDDSSLQGANLPDNSILFQVCFDLANDAAGNAAITFSDTPISIEVTDVQGSIIAATFQSGNITINCDSGNTGGDGGTGGDNSGDMTDGDNSTISDTLGFSVGQVTGNCGEQVCVGITTIGFADIVSFQYSMNWDAALLGNPTLQQFGLPDMDVSQFNSATPGVLRVGYDDSSLQGRSLTDGTVLYQLCFDIAADAAGTSEVNFSANPIAIEVVDVQSNILTPILQNGALTIACLDTMSMDTMITDTTTMDTMPPLPELPLGFSISTDTSNCGDQVCLDVSVQGFSSVTSFRYSMNWNAQLMGSEEIASTNLDGIRFGPLAPGVFFTEWIDPTGQGVTLADNEIIYTVCFNQFTSTENTATVSFSSVPIPIRVTTADGLTTTRLELNAGQVFITCDPIDMDTMSNDVADSLSFAINSLTGNCGEQVCTAVTAQDFNNIFSFQYSLTYSADLGAVSVQNFGLAGLSESNFNLNEPGTVRVGWDDSSLEGVSIPDNQVLFDLCFDVGATISGDFEVAFSNTPLAIETVDVDGNILNPSFQDGALTIACEVTPPPVDTTVTPVDTMITPETLQLAIADGTVNCGDQICIDVTTQGFNEILSFQYSINWNPNILGNPTFQGFNLTGLGAGNFNAEAPGIIRTGWTDPNVTGVTMVEDAVLYQICFDAIGNEAATTDVQFSNIPLAIEILGGDAEPIEATFKNGTVMVECTVIEPPVDTIPNNIGDELTFMLSQTTGNCTEQVCMDVTVQNFNDILTYQYSVNWDANLLGQASIQGFNMAGLSAANFNTATPGVLRVGWDDTSISGVSLPDNQVIYQICFDNINAAVESLPISFSGTPIPVEVVDNQNNLVNPEFINGNLTISCDDGNNGGGPVEGDLIFRLSPTTVNCGEQICSNVQVNGFNNILSFQYSIIWDAAALGTATVQAFGIPDINASNFNDNTPGILRVGWDDTFITGVTLPNDHILFQVCFDPVDEPIENIGINFSGSPTSIEVIDRNSQPITPILQNGTITANCDTTNPVDADNDGFNSDVDCDDNNAAINPNGIEIANNGIDEDCNGADLVTVFPDNDGDGFTSDVDCDDNNPIIFPGATEFPNNNVDEDCDGIALFIDADNDGFNSSLDCDDNNASINSGATEIPDNGIDEDCDGADLVTVFPDNDGDGFTSDVDCDDNNPIIFPGATEFPNNNVDEDCDGIAQFIDADNDGFNSSIDCDDNNPNINGRGIEIPNNGIDEDCDGEDLVLAIDADNDGFDSIVDCDDNNPNINTGATEIPDNGIDEDCDGADLVTIFPDNDGDGFTSDIDCDDNDPNINPNATEIANNGIDEDCDGISLFIDVDGDGFNSSMDCDDNNPNINPNATEIANNGIDEDCDGEDLIQAIDADNDGFDSEADCDDNNPNINPNATEIANNGIDEDCDGEDLIQVIDADNDGFDSEADCDDNNPNINPNATEIANNGIDEDCDGEDLIQAIDADNDGFDSEADCDDNDPNINPNATEIANNGIDEDCDGISLFIDVDGDGFNSSMDCDDNNPNINPNATEIANNGIDEDCDGEDLIQAIDADNDGFDSEADCDDNNPNINPNATEIPNNGIDEDCNGEDLIGVDDNAVTIRLSNATATCGSSQVCLDATAGNFKDLISFQYSLNWDPTLLGNVTTQNYNLAGLNNSAFFAPQEGVMRVSWFDTQVAGVSADNDQIIFQICFDIISNSNATAIVQFSGNPIPIEIIDQTGNEMATNLVDAVINIENCANIIMSETNTPTIATGTKNQNTLPPSSIAFSAIKNNKKGNSLENIQLYPNPTTNRLNLILENPLPENGEIRLYNIWGKLLQIKPIGKTQNQTHLNLGGFASGVYLVEIRTGNTFVRKRVVRK